MDYSRFQLRLPSPGTPLDLEHAHSQPPTACSHVQGILAQSTRDLMGRSIRQREGGGPAGIVARHDQPVSQIRGTVVQVAWEIARAEGPGLWEAWIVVPGHAGSLAALDWLVQNYDDVRLGGEVTDNTWCVRVWGSGRTGPELSQLPVCDAESDGRVSEHIRVAAIEATAMLAQVALDRFW